MCDHDAEAYFARMYSIHSETDPDLPEGHCPALVAEYLQLQAEWALIETAEQFFPEVTNNKLLCGTASKGGSETRREYIDLLIGLVVNAPDYQPPHLNPPSPGPSGSLISAAKGAD